MPDILYGRSKEEVLLYLAENHTSPFVKRVKAVLSALGLEPSFENIYIVCAIIDTTDIREYLRMDRTHDYDYESESSSLNAFKNKDIYSIIVPIQKKKKIYSLDNTVLADLPKYPLVIKNLNLFYQYKYFFYNEKETPARLTTKHKVHIYRLYLTNKIYTNYQNEIRITDKIRSRFDYLTISKYDIFYEPYERREIECVPDTSHDLLLNTGAKTSVESVFKIKHVNPNEYLRRDVRVGGVKVCGNRIYKRSFVTARKDKKEVVYNEYASLPMSDGIPILFNDLHLINHVKTHNRLSSVQPDETGYSVEVYGMERTFFSSFDEKLMKDVYISRNFLENYFREKGFLYSNHFNPYEYKKMEKVIEERILDTTNTIFITMDLVKAFYSVKRIDKLFDIMPTQEAKIYFLSLYRLIRDTNSNSLPITVISPLLFKLFISNILDKNEDMIMFVDDCFISGKDDADIEIKLKRILKAFSPYFKINSFKITRRDKEKGLRFLRRNFSFDPNDPMEPDNKEETSEDVESEEFKDAESEESKDVVSEESKDPESEESKDPESSDFFKRITKYEEDLLSSVPSIKCIVCYMYDNIGVLDCGHVVCKSCALKMEKRCPYCRKSFYRPIPIISSF